MEWSSQLSGIGGALADSADGPGAPGLDGDSWEHEGTSPYVWKNGPSGYPLSKTGSRKCCT